MRDDAPHDDAWVDPRVVHPREPGQRRVAVRAAKRLAEGRQHVVKHRLVAAQHPLLDRLLGDFLRDADAAVRAHRRGQHGQLQRVERAAHVSARHLRDVVKRLVVQCHMQLAVAPLLVGRCAQDRLFHVLLRQRHKLKQPAARHDGRGHGDHRILGRRADEPDRSLLNRGQDRVGLRLAPPVALVQQQVGALTIQSQAAFRLLQRVAQVAHPAGHGVQSHEGRPRRVRDDRRQRGFSCAGRAVKDRAGQPVGLDGSAQKPPFPHDRPLPQKLIQRSRTHPVGQRCLALLVRLKQILHGLLPLLAPPIIAHSPAFEKHNLMKAGRRQNRALHGQNPSVTCGDSSPFR